MTIHFTVSTVHEITKYSESERAAALADDKLSLNVVFSKYDVECAGF